MSQYEIYTFFLCLIVFVALTGGFGLLIWNLVKLSLKLIKSGAEDEVIKTEYRKEQERKKACLTVLTDKIVSLIFCAVVFLFFGFSLFVNFSKNAVFEEIPTMRVVQSASMAQKHSKNTYLFENNLNDQFKTFDLILTYKLPEEDDLELYDIVVYEVDGVYLVHRIVGIEEPNDKHPNERYFLLQGDAVESPDRFPVHYDQMRAIYRGQRVPFLGSFISFMQSPAGYLCLALVVFVVLIYPPIEKRLNAEKKKRLIAMGEIEFTEMTAGEEDDRVVVPMEEERDIYDKPTETETELEQLSNDSDEGGGVA